MTWTNFWCSIGAIFEFLFEFLFKIIKRLGQTPNALVWIVIISLLAFWILQLRKQAKEAKKNGTYI